jgi:hypothetical protein
MIEFHPADAREVLNLAVNRVIVCWGSQVALLPLVDFLENERQCGVHKSATFPDPESMEAVQKNLRPRPDGNVVILNTDEGALLPYHIKYGADLVLRGDADGSIHVYKNRGEHSFSAMVFRCTGTSSPTGRTFDPSGPRLQNIRPMSGRSSWSEPRRGPSMGVAVAKPDHLCPMCAAGLPLIPSKTKFAEQPTGTMAMTKAKELTLTGPDGREFIKLTADGDAFVRGEKIAAGQQDIFEMFRAWVKSQFVTAEVKFPVAGKPDAQGNVFTKECLDDLRKQVWEHGLIPTPKFNTGSYGGPVWDDDATKPVMGRTRTKTGYDITDGVENQRLRGIIRDLCAEMTQAARAWEKDLHVGDIMQRLVDIAEGRVQPASPRGLEKADDKAARMAALSDAVKQLLCDLHPINYAHMAPQWDRFVEAVRKLGIIDVPTKK